METENQQIAVFASGCFWCTEAVFNRVEGVLKVLPGYTGGFIKNPPYREVCTGRTGHAEGIKIWYDETKVSYKTLLEVFFATHDPTTLNRQGADVGTQYRSAIFYTNDEQKQLAEQMIKLIDDAKLFNHKIVTEVKPLDVFYVAEVDHHKYYDLNKNQPYCQYVIDPKIKKLETYFKNELKSSATTN
ncbi:peptide-methionine (S)-S-oxide reductase MsrA [Zhouia sp. PK063]|uniref:peptide-methionine (S)-S-oxide reductase MsrA n=1 Tax=Zhouia sp. PK063 TaxID=3373602 RepID=UPI00378842AE